MHNTRKSPGNDVVLEVPHFASSVYKSIKHFNLGFAFDAPKIWNDFPDDVRSATSLHSMRKKVETYVFGKAYLPQVSVLSQYFSVMLTPAMCLAI